MSHDTSGQSLEVLRGILCIKFPLANQCTWERARKDEEFERVLRLEPWAVRSQDAESVPRSSKLYSVATEVLVYASCDDSGRLLLSQ